MDVIAPLIADREPAVLRNPAQCALHNPPESPQPRLAENVFARAAARLAQRGRPERQGKAPGFGQRPGASQLPSSSSC